MGLCDVNLADGCRNAQAVASEGITQLGGSGEEDSLVADKYEPAAQFPATVKLPHYMTRRIILF